MTSDLFRFVYFRLNEASVNFNLWQYIDCRWLDAFSTPTLTACKNDPSPRSFLSINTSIHFWFLIEKKLWHQNDSATQVSNLLITIKCQYTKVPLGLRWGCLSTQSTHPPLPRPPLEPPNASFFPHTVMFLSFRTDRSEQTVQTQIRLIRVYTVCNRLCIFWMHYYKEKPSCSTFRVISTNFENLTVKILKFRTTENCSGVRKFRIFYGSLSSLLILTAI